MCVSAIMCVCLSASDHSSMSECTRVCVLLSVTACVHYCVCTGVYLYKDGGGVLDPRGHSSNAEAHPFP